MSRMFVTLHSSKREEYNSALADLEHLVCTSVLEGCEGCWEKRNLAVCSGNTLRHTWQREEEEEGDRSYRGCGSTHMFFILTEGFRQLFTRDAC